MAGEPQETNYRSTWSIEQPLLTPLQLPLSQRSVMSLYEYNKAIIERWDKNIFDGVSYMPLDRAH